LKILHIVAGDLDGGAARGAYWLHEGLKKLNIKSKLFPKRKKILESDSIFS
jgi:hypothetical protein